jgi:hypothetical protein
VLEQRLTADYHLNFLTKVAAFGGGHASGDRARDFQHDGAPPHFCRQVMTYLNQQYENSWIGHRGPITWPPRSPDLTPLVFFL